MNKLRTVGVLVVSLALGFGSKYLHAQAAEPTQAAKEDLPHPRTLDELRKAMADVVEKNHLPGAGVALVSRGEVLWCGGFGKADIAASRDINCDTEFRTGSVSKSFISLA